MRYRLAVVLTAIVVLSSLSSCPVVVVPQPFVAGTIFYTISDGDIGSVLHRMDVSGANATPIATYEDTYGVRNIAIDPEFLQVYIQTTNGGILRAGFDGMTVQLTDPHPFGESGFALDLYRRQIYWLRWISSSGYRIHHASMDGSDVTEFSAMNIVTPRVLAIDPVNLTLYYASRGSPGIPEFETEPGVLVRADIDGTNGVVINNNFLSPTDILLDVAMGHLYLAATGGGIFPPAIYRMDLDGSNFMTIVDFESRRIGVPSDIDIDLVARKLYWTRNRSAVGTPSEEGRIQRANLDGSDIEDVLILPVGIAGLALAP